MKDPVEQIFGGMAQDLDKAEQSGKLTRRQRVYVAAIVSVGFTAALTGVLSNITPTLLESVGLETEIPRDTFDFFIIVGGAVVWLTSVYFAVKTRQ